MIVIRGYVFFEYDSSLNESFVVAIQGGVGLMQEKGEIPKELEE